MHSHSVVDSIVQGIDMLVGVSPDTESVHMASINCHDKFLSEIVSLRCLAPLNQQQHTPGYIRIQESGYIRTHQDTSGYIRTHQETSGHIRTHQSGHI
eukprot:333442-Hanusia_phi.AAC.1